MPITAQQTQLARRIDTHVRHIMAQGGSDEALLMSMADSMGTFKQLFGISRSSSSEASRG